GSGRVSEPDRLGLLSRSVGHAGRQGLLPRQFVLRPFPGAADLPLDRSRELDPDRQRHRPAGPAGFRNPGPVARRVRPDDRAQGRDLLHPEHLRRLRRQLPDHRPRSGRSLVRSGLAARSEGRHRPRPVLRHRRLGLDRQQRPAGGNAPLRGPPRHLDPALRSRREEDLRAAQGAGGRR
ncbi:hypothetical protein LTR94_031716, partial [Friedmanniomyces endolithicus]